MPNPPMSAEDFRERFHQAYRELFDSGLSEVDAATRALLIAGGRESGSSSAEVDTAAATRNPATTGPSRETSRPTSPTYESPKTEFVQSDTTSAGVVAVLEDNTCSASTFRPNNNGGSSDVVMCSVATVVNEASQQEALIAARAGKRSPGETETKGEEVELAQKGVEVEEQQLEDEEEVDGELITPARVQAMIEIGRESGTFRELIAFLSRALSSPSSVAASFAPHPADREALLHNQTQMLEGKLSAHDSSEDATASRPAAEPGQPFSNRDLKQTGSIEQRTLGGKARAGAGEKETTQQKGVEPIGMDMEAASVIWRMLRQLGEEEVTRAVRIALETLMCSCDNRSAGGRDPEEEGNRGGLSRVDLRAMLLVLEHPEVQDPDFAETLTTLFELATNLPCVQVEGLIQFFAGVEEERFSRYLGAIHQFIALRLYSGGKASSVLSAVQFIHVLHAANQAASTPKVEDEAFYSEAINSELFGHRSSLMDDYSAWRQDIQETNPAQYMSLISFGEVLNPASKAAVLSLDSQLQMRGVINSELQGALFAGGVWGAGLVLTPYLILRVRRDNIVADSLHALVMTPEEDLKKPLKVQFVGEDGVDEGGVQKEYFQVMLRELLDPKYAMFRHDEETRTLWFNSDSLEAREEFELVGMLLGIAIYNSIILDLRFPTVVYKRVMGVTPTLQDLEDAQPSLGRGLRQLLDFEGDVEATFARSFQLSYEVFGAVKTFDLKENGGDTAVSEANRREYVDLYVQWLLVDSVKDQYGPFERGFQKVVGGRALSLFRPSELELLICGNPRLDFDALERNSKYEDGLKRDDQIVRNFWEVVHEFSENSKRKLLKFVTGSDRVPIQGLGSSGLSLVISRNGDDSDRLPTAHTCFNHLLLPSYATKEKLANRLRLAIEQSEGFGLR